MKAITLPTCTLMRQTCNEILADVLFYFTSFHGQTLVNLITQEFNKQYQEFVVQHPNFKGKVAIVGHSLGGVISYDILANQGSEQVQIPEFPQSTTHFPLVYPKLDFVPDLFFVLGSPIAAVMVMRGQDVKQYRLPKEIRFFNIFSLYDPLAYRLEPLLNKRYTEISPVLLKRPSQAHTAF
ncbi:DDHD domain-containing protein, partial [Gorgonomyces haynaldii]